jgi:hypothetical protein
MKRPSTDADKAFQKSSQWTEACTHSQAGMVGYTCGLWDLFHILTIGASLYEHQLYGFRSGYLTGSQHVAEILKRFIANFLSCDVCRWNFVSSFENCTHDHCHRLAPVMPSLVSNGDDQSSTRELALWFWEVHNSINVRLMKESAERDDREVTEQELLAAVFPTRAMCPDCWFDDDKMEQYDKAAVFAFLQSWYWPANDDKGSSFLPAAVRSRIKRNVSHSSTLTISFIPVVVLLTMLVRRLLLRKTRTRGQRKHL